MYALGTCNLRKGSGLWWGLEKGTGDGDKDMPRRASGQVPRLFDRSCHWSQLSSHILPDDLLSPSEDHMANGA